jgi:hypothetical protein
MSKIAGDAAHPEKMPGFIASSLPCALRGSGLDAATFEPELGSLPYMRRSIAT